MDYSWCKEVENTSSIDEYEYFQSNWCEEYISSSSESDGEVGYFENYLQNNSRELEIQPVANSELEDNERCFDLSLVPEFTPRKRPKTDIPCPMPGCPVTKRQHHQMRIHYWTHCCRSCGEKAMDMTNHVCEPQEGAGIEADNEEELELGNFFEIETTQNKVISTLRWIGNNEIIVSLSQLIGLVKDDFIRFLKHFVKKYKSVKFEVLLVPILEDVKLEKKLFPYMHSSFIGVAHETFIEESVNRAFETIGRVLSIYNENGSGFTLTGVSRLELTIAKVNLVTGGKRKTLPKALSRLQGLVPVKTEQVDDETCFKYAILASLYSKFVKNKWKSSSYTDLEQLHDWSELKFPVSPSDAIKWSERNNIGLNIFGHEDKTIYTIKTTPRRYEKVANILLVCESEDSNGHYIAVENLSKLLGCKGKRKHFWCRFCLNKFSTETRMLSHEVDCQGFEMQRIVLEEPNPDGKPKLIEFESYHKLWKFSHVIYADFETLSVPKEVEMTSKLTKKRQLDPIGFGILYIRPGGEYKYYSYFGERAVEKFLQLALSIADEALEEMKHDEGRWEMGSQEIREFNETDTCDFCQVKLTKETGKVGHHDHSESFTKSSHYGGVINISCNRCNLAIRPRKFIPCVFHGFGNFDGKIIAQGFKYKCIENVKLFAINSEKYIGMQINEKLRIMDSLPKLGASLDNLVRNAKEKDGVGFFKYTCREFAHLGSELDNILNKQVFCYDYISSFDKLLETQLPPRENFYNLLTEKECSEEDYEKALYAFKLFKCKNILEFYEIYLKFDVFLLADLHEKFRESCIERFQLDSLHNLTPAAFSFECLLYKHKVKFPKITSDMIDFLTALRKSMYGGLTFANLRKAEANLKCLSNYDPTKPKTQLFFYDFASLYGFIMTLRHPSGNFKRLDEQEIAELSSNNFEKLKSFGINDEKGYFLRVDAHCPPDVQDRLLDLPPFPERYFVSYDNLSSYQTEEISRIYNDHVPSANQRLCLTFFPKTGYWIHSSALGTFVRLGAVVTKVTDGWSCDETYVLRDYVQRNIALRAEAKDEISRAMLKLATNVIFGYSIMDLSKRKNVVVALNPFDAKKQISKPTFSNLIQIDENVTIISHRKGAAEFKTAYYVGSSVLWKSKCHVYETWYQKLKFGIWRNHISSLVYIDTDSFLGMIQLHDNEEDMNDTLKGQYEIFDFSNLDKSHALYSERSKGVSGVLKDEIPNRFIVKGIFLAPKTYTLLTTNEIGEHVTGKVRAKGVKEYQKRKLLYENFEKILNEGGCHNIEMNAIRSKDQILYILRVKKIGLSALMIKSFLVPPDGIKTLPFGYHKLVNNSK